VDRLGFEWVTAQGLSRAPPPAHIRPEASGAVGNPVFIAQAAALIGGSGAKYILSGVCPRWEQRSRRAL